MGELVGLFHKLSCPAQVLPAFLLVMTLLGNGTDRTAVNTSAAGSISEKETVGPVVVIRTGHRFNVYFSHHRPHPHGLALDGNEPITQTKGAQTGRMGRMWLLRAWLDKKIEPSRRFQEILFSCTACGNCMEQCALTKIKDKLLLAFTAGKESLVFCEGG